MRRSRADLREIRSLACPAIREQLGAKSSAASVQTARTMGNARPVRKLVRAEPHATAHMGVSADAPSCDAKSTERFESRKATALRHELIHLASEAAAARFRSDDEASRKNNSAGRAPPATFSTPLLREPTSQPARRRAS